MSCKSKRIVAIPVDAGENSKIAFNWYLTQGCREGDFCVFIHAVESPNLKSVSLTDPLNVPYKDWQDALQKNLDASKEISNFYLSECEKNKIKSAFEMATGGKTSQAICEKIAEVGADCVVVGTRGLKGVQRAFIGSTSSYLIQHCGKPVTVVPEPKCN